MSNSPKIRRRTQSGAAAEIQVLSAGAMGEIVRDLGDAYERTTGIKVRAEFSRSPLVRDRIRAGEPFDVVITTQSRVEELGGANRLVPDTVAIVARSLIGAAVRAGRPKPNIASIDAFVGTLRAASSIACADPAFGTASGLYLVDLFDRLGLTAELKPKTRFIGAAGGAPVVVCAAVADGRAELGIQQIAEIVSVPGVDLVGPLSREIQHVTVFAVAVASAAPNQSLARDFLSQGEKHWRRWCRPTPREMPWGQAGTTKLGKIRRPQMGMIQRPLTGGPRKPQYACVNGCIFLPEQRARYFHVTHRCAFDPHRWPQDKRAFRGTFLGGIAGNCRQTAHDLLRSNEHYRCATSA